MKRYYPQIIMPDDIPSFIRSWGFQIKNEFEPKEPIKPRTKKPEEPDKYSVSKIYVFFFLCFIFSFFVQGILFCRILELVGGSTCLLFLVPSVIIASYFTYEWASKIEKQEKEVNDKYEKELEKFQKRINNYDVKMVMYAERAEEFKNNLKKPEFRIELRKELLKQILEDSEPATIDFKNCIRGKSELDFEYKIKEWFGDTISTDKVIEIFDDYAEDEIFEDESFIEHESTNSRRAYVPDFYFSHPEFNLNIDIELDEPYYRDHSNHKPIHYLSNEGDKKRNEFFIDHKWIIIRFSEEQVVRYPDSCCREIAELIYDLSLDKSYLDKLIDIPRLPRMERWSKEDAKELIRQRSRNQYNIPKSEPIIDENHILGIWENERFIIGFENNRIVQTLKKSSDKFLWKKRSGKCQLGKEYSQRKYIKVNWDEGGVSFFVIDNLTSKELIFTDFHFKFSVRLSKEREITKIKNDTGIQSPASIKHMLNAAIKQNRKVKIKYEKIGGQESVRELSNLNLSNEFGEFGYENDHIKAYCHLRNEERSFKIDRIKQIKLIK